MRFFFKTDYNQDINLFRDNVDRFWYGLLLLALLGAPFVLEDFWLGEISYVLILSIIGIGLMLLTGYTGQVSLGHAAFLGIGAYTHAVLLGLGVPFVVSVFAATVLSALIGASVHSGEDVILTASGPGSERVHGSMDNTEVFRVMVDALGLAAQQ